MYRRAVLTAVGAGAASVVTVGTGTASLAATSNGVPEGYERRWDTAVRSVGDRILVSGSRVFVVGQRVRAYDDADGALVWESDRDVTTVPEPVAADGTLYVRVASGPLVGFGADGAVTVTVDLESEDPRFLVHRPTALLVVRDGARLFAVDPDDGSVAWEHEVRESPAFGYLVGARRDPAVAVVTDRRQLLIRVADGRIRWERDRFTMANSTVLGPDRVYMDHDDGLLALDRETGDVDWRREITAEVLATDRQGVLARTVDGIVSLSADVERRWRNGLASLVEGAAYYPFVGPRRVYAIGRGSGGPLLAAVSLEDGTRAWETPITTATDPDGEGRYAPPTLSPQHVYAGGGGGLTVATIGSGAVAGRFDFETPVVGWPTVTDDALVVRTEGRVHVFDRPACSTPSVADGNARYVFPAPGPRSLEVSADFDAVDCPWHGALTAVADGDDVGTVPVSLTPSDTTLDTTVRDVALPDGLDTVTFVLSAPDGSAVARSSVPLTYRDESGTDVVEREESTPRTAGSGSDEATTDVAGNGTTAPLDGPPSTTRRGAASSSSDRGGPDLWLYGIGGVGVVAGLAGVYWWHRRE